MTAVILAAGISSRLRPLTNDIPKALLSLGGKTLLQRTLEALEFAGLERCIIVCGFGEDVIRTFLKTFTSRVNIRIISNPLYASTGNNYSLWCAGPEIAGSGILLLDSDIVFDQRILTLLCQAPHENALVMRPDRSLGPEEIKVEVDTGGNVMNIGKNIEPRDAAGESIGIEKFSALAAGRLFTVLQTRKDHNEFYEASFQQMIDAGEKIYAMPSSPYQCMEIDTLEDLAAAESLVKGWS